MKYALVNKEKSEATPKMRGTCPGCGGETIAKCGALKIWHWAHIGEDCDPWHEPESAWHLGWKREAPSARCEVVMGPHRADIVGRDGVVIELQHSSISVDDIYAREQFYKRMIWLVDAEPFAKNVGFRERESYWTFRWKHPRAHHGEFNAPLFWDVEEYAKRALAEAELAMQRAVEKELKWCTQDQLKENLKTNQWYWEAVHARSLYTRISAAPIFEIKRIAVKPPCGGWGHWHTRKDFIEKYISGSLF